MHLKVTERWFNLLTINKDIPQYINDQQVLKLARLVVYLVPTSYHPIIYPYPSPWELFRIWYTCSNGKITSFWDNNNKHQQTKITAAVSVT